MRGPKDNRGHNKRLFDQDHLKSKIDQLEVDFEKVRFWYTLDNFENKHDPISIKVNIGNGQISLSRNGAVPIPTTALKDLHKRIREATQFSNKFIQDKYSSSNKLASFDVKLSIISASTVPYFIAIWLTVTTKDKKYLLTLDMLNFLLKQIAVIVWECLQHP